MKEYLLKLKRHFFFAALFSLFINVLYLTFPIYMLAIYDRVLVSYSKPTLYTITFGAIFAYVVYGILSFLRSRLLVYVSVRIDRDLRDDIFHALVLDSSRLDKSGYRQGISDLNIIRQYLAGSAIFSLFDLPWTPIYLIIIYFMHPILGGVATAGGLVIFILGFLQEKLSKESIELSNIEHQRANSLMYMTLGNAEPVNAMGMSRSMLRLWAAIHDRSLLLQTVASKHAGLLQSISRVVRQLMQVFIYGIGAYLTLEHKSTAGIMIAASIIMGKALMPVEQLMATWKMTVDARQAYRRLSEFWDRIQSRPQPMELPPPAGRLDLEGVSLAVDDRTLLNNVSFHLDPGETLGVIGPSGAGKSTLCRVLLGLWEPTAGNVRLDGSDIHGWDRENLGRYIGYLPQDVVLFPGTVAENIARMGEVVPERVIKAAKEAGVHDLILRLPKGYDTPIAQPGGVILSGGQRQRVGLARALYGDIKLLVLDEPNSNLDEEGERRLIQALILMKQRGVTTVLVTHKPGILGVADKILVMREGTVVMFGPRDKVFGALAGQAKVVRGPVTSVKKRG